MAVGPAHLRISALLALATLAAAATQPNFIFFLSDDQDSTNGGDWNMSLLAELMANEGVNFTRHITNYALCCPARATILTGMCSHNHGVVGNFAPLGGMRRFNQRKLERLTAPYLLQQAGYRTAYIGKYLNGYEEMTARYTPPGYDRWFSIRHKAYYQWTAGDQGKLVRFGTNESDYLTDVLTAKALEFLNNGTADPRPFFLFLGNYAPHEPAIPARRHNGTLAGLTVPRVPSFNEKWETLRTKALPIIRDSTPLTNNEMRAFDLKYQMRAETLLAVDEQIQAVIEALTAMGQLDNTYLFYASDNGYKQGHHRRTGKYTAYEHDIRVPLYVRGPGVPKGLQLPHLVSNTDFVPTWLELAGVPDPYADQRDGKSFAPLLLDEATHADPDVFRVGVLIEKLQASESDLYVSPIVPIADPANDPFAGYRDTNQTSGCDEETCEDEDSIERNLGATVDQGMLRTQEAALGIRPMSVQTIRRGILPTAYYGLRVQSVAAGSWKLIQYPVGSELYDLDQDPHELINIYEMGPPGLIDYLDKTLAVLKVCRGLGCSILNASAMVQALQVLPRCRATIEGAGVCAGEQQECNCTAPNRCDPDSLLCQAPPACNATYEGVRSCSGAKATCTCVFPATCSISTKLCQLPPVCEASTEGEGVCTGNSQYCTCVAPDRCNPDTKLCQLGPDCEPTPEGNGVCCGEAPECYCRYPHTCDSDSQLCKAATCASYDKCGAHGSCKLVPGDRICECEAGWTGQFCGMPTCDTYTLCDAQGTCAIEAGAHTCKCQPGYTGTVCDQEVCTANPTEACPGVGYTCLMDSAAPYGYKCLDPCTANPSACPGVGYKCILNTSAAFGFTCQDPCTANPGACPAPGFKCIVDDKAAEGFTCQDPCASSPCTGKGYTCAIDGGAPSGYQCQDPCTANPGACPAAGFTCALDASADSGFKCLATCANYNPCGQNGDCAVLANNTHACVCKNGWAGLACEVDPCTANPNACPRAGYKCVVNATQATGYTCKDPCTSNPCNGKGYTCAVDGSAPSGYRCQDPCTANSGACSNKPFFQCTVDGTAAAGYTCEANCTGYTACGAHGQCIIANNTHACACSAGWTGAACTKPPPCNATYAGAGVCIGPKQNCLCDAPDRCYTKTKLCKKLPACKATTAGAGVCTGPQQNCLCIAPNKCDTKTSLCKKLPVCMATAKGAGVCTGSKQDCYCKKPNRCILTSKLCKKPKIEKPAAAAVGSEGVDGALAANASSVAGGGEAEALPPATG